MLQYAGLDSQCGTEKNCITCGTGPDSCANIPNAIQNECQYNELKKRFGCYKWWANPKNPTASNWFKMFKDLGLTDTYRWVYDETMLYVPKPSNYNENIKMRPVSVAEWYKPNNPSQAYTML